jgi:hypothetical protein
VPDLDLVVTLGCVKMVLHGHYRHDALVRIVKMLAGLFRGHGARLQHQDAGDDLKAVGDTMLQLPEQHVFLPEQLLRLPQQLFLLAFDGPPLGDILEGKKKGRVSVGKRRESRDPRQARPELRKITATHGSSDLRRSWSWASGWATTTTGQ